RLDHRLPGVRQGCNGHFTSRSNDARLPRRRASTGHRRVAVTPPQHTALTLPAPAKLNLFLHVTGRRPDGYHTLESLVVPIDRADFITLTLRDDEAVTRTHGAAGVAVDDDLAILAARLVQRECGVTCGVEIGVDKRVPMG